MKVFVQILIVLFISDFCLSQNLITNPSFENLSSCYGDPANIGFDVFEWASCSGWSNPIMSSSDLWCQNPSVGNNVPPQLPGIGYQMPRTGNSMAGFLIGDPIVSNYREYIQNELVETLKPLNYYRFSCYISTCCLPCTVSNLGVSLTSQKVQNNNWNLNNSIVYGENSPLNFLDDTLDWKKIEIDFLALGGERYIQIGSFTDSSQLSINGCQNNEFINNYYFIDDVELTETGKFELPNIITPNNDGINDNWILPFSKALGPKKVSILNRWGNLIYEGDLKNFAWDGRTQNGDECIDGIYFYRISNTNVSGFIQLVH